ncbi:MAG: SUF system Fe-S cluster assembly regulator [Acetobacter sp.]|nr:SUF system Fe-S cluster assembly regulator [Acetobacter sp.]
MLKLSRLTDYAVVILVRLGEQEGGGTSALLATKTGLSEPTVAKVLKTLSSVGLVLSRRGAKGGYKLARSLSDISVASVIVAMDGKIELTAGVDGGGCENGVFCGLQGRWDLINKAIRTTLENISLATMCLYEAENTPELFNACQDFGKDFSGGCAALNDWN